MWNIECNHFLLCCKKGWRWSGVHVNSDEWSDHMHHLQNVYMSIRPNLVYRDWVVHSQMCHFALIGPDVITFFTHYSHDNDYRRRHKHSTQQVILLIWSDPNISLAQPAPDVFYLNARSITWVWWTSYIQVVSTRRRFLGVLTAAVNWRQKEGKIVIQSSLLLPNLLQFLAKCNWQ